MPNLSEAFTRLDQYLQRKIKETRTAGFAVAVTNRKKLLGVRTCGYADVAARKPVTPNTLFEIGSIGKSFTAMALLQLHEAGKLDLHAPVTRYLPWFQVRSQYEPITVHHLLSHTAGIVSSPDLTSDSRYDVHALRETETGFPPGAHFYYSNIGYRTLGLMLEEITGQSYAEVIRTRILEPLGMKDSDPVITHETRKHLAVGYQRFYDDRPSNPSHPLVPATWLETGTGDGSLACTAADLAKYLRALLNRGRGLISEASFQLLTQRVIEEDEPGWYYGYGLGTFQVEGFTCLGHGGDMPGFSAGMQGDLDTGVGVCLLVNQSQVFGITSHLLTLFRAALRGKELPPLPPLASRTHIENAADYTGTYRAGDGQSRGIAPTLMLIAKGKQLALKHGGELLPLESRGEDTFFVNHPDFALFLLRFGRINGVVVEAAHGPNWYAHKRYTGPTTIDYPQAWEAFVGHYRSYNPWLSNFRVVLRKGGLLQITPEGTETPLAPLPEDLFRVGAEAHSPERLRFDSVVGGRALRANLSGCDYYRAFTP